MKVVGCIVPVAFEILTQITDLSFVIFCRYKIQIFICFTDFIDDLEHVEPCFYFYAFKFSFFSLPNHFDDPLPSQYTVYIRCM